MSMKTPLLTSAAFVAFMSLGWSAHSQVAVYDGANYVNTLREVATAARQLAQLQAQLQQLQQTYAMLTNPTNITGMLPALNAPFLHNSMPAVSAAPGQLTGSSGTLTSSGQTFYGLNHVYTAAGADPLAINLNRSAISIANIQGMAATNLASIEQRLANLGAMQLELQSASDIKQVTAINGRIAIESNAIQGQQAQAQNLQTLATTQAEADQQAAIQNIRHGHEQAAAQFTGTLN